MVVRSVHRVCIVSSPSPSSSFCCFANCIARSIVGTCIWIVFDCSMRFFQRKQNEKKRKKIAAMAVRIEESSAQKRSDACVLFCVFFLFFLSFFVYCNWNYMMHATMLHILMRFSSTNTLTQTHFALRLFALYCVASLLSPPCPLPQLVFNYLLL